MNGFFEKKEGALSYMAAGNLSEAGGVSHAFTTRRGGVSTDEFSSLNLGINRGDNKENVSKNYDIICGTLKIDPNNLVYAAQEHGDGVIIIKSGETGHGITKKPDRTGDAFVTAEPGVALIVFTADCIPVLLYDPKSRVIAAVHSGWRGTALGITKKTAEIMKSRYGCMPGNILAAIGPGIGKCCFETDSDVPGAFYGVLGHIAGGFIEKSGERWNVDLKGINRHWLMASGISDKNIAISEECTMCMHEKYWSHRKTGGVRGSQAAIISLRVSGF